MLTKINGLGLVDLTKIVRISEGEGDRSVYIDGSQWTTITHDQYKALCDALYNSDLLGYGEC